MKSFYFILCALFFLFYEIFTQNIKTRSDYPIFSEYIKKFNKTYLTTEYVNR